MFTSIGSLAEGSYFVTLNARGETSGERYFIVKHLDNGRTHCQKVGGEDDGQRYDFLSAMMVFA